MAKKINAKEKHLRCFRRCIGRFAWERTFPANCLIRSANCLSENLGGITYRLTWHRIMPPSTDGLTNSEVTGCFAGNRAVQRQISLSPLRGDPSTGGAEQSALDSPERSVRNRTQSLRMKRTSLNTILRKDLRLHPYRIQVR